jgi:hypothetical protein
MEQVAWPHSKPALRWVYEECRVRQLSLLTRGPFPAAKLLRPCCSLGWLMLVLRCVSILCGSWG